MQIGGCTSRPRGAWVVRQARTLALDLTDRARPARFLLHDRDSKRSAAFDELFRTEGARVVRTPIRAPNANAYAERWVRTVRRECLDWLLILARRQLERVLRTYVDPYRRRPHRASTSTCQIRSLRSCHSRLPGRRPSVGEISSAACSTNTSARQTTEFMRPTGGGVLSIR